MTDKTTKKTTKPKKAAAKPRLSRKEKALTKKIEKLEENVEKLTDELVDQQLRVQAAEEKMLRVVAEYENGKKRVEREKERSLSFAKDRVLIGLFPIIDNIERSSQYEKDESDSENTSKGITLVLDQIQKYLKDTDDVEAYDPVGEPFDPELHDAMAMHPSDDHESGIIIEVFEKGYKSGDRVLRAAKVVVSQ
ncbi:MAG: nucleotide exchange factor GrpE [Candidatus Marinimicrobia bacterium]|jgi:molecular chaperone GrpE|nr:nucleotide exchange factor GrpE [Candidatus Neomarinimicrobiota bacterium]MBT3629885.1 nucleotide exchange factor GrpE [Candidatus Neomarinimicrobiota bacterium]MBT3823652.1 nucleotide exchange factor GrpE [Candidatus Neomarinimicrobiota bacterium]MBT4131025.1 nucleotide exchange factor GrpE [Candidatus Neomarinimicrobiota bacterium]MBT4295985.1 nucleotide exchange factor GrpE [Candidatus Neomarinimicrobiota bacterium]